MKRIALAAVTAVVLSGCGAGPQLSVTIEPLAGGIDYKVWLFGAAVTCSATANTAAGRAVLEGSSQCGDAGVDTSLCFMQLDQVAVNTTFRFDAVTPGSRTLFGIERDTGLNAIGWACGGVTVSSGNASAVTLSFVAGP
jgi:hypothetical protein